MRVLVVDPNRLEREATARLFAGGKHEVHVAADAASALVHLDGGAFDVLLIEMVTPARSGLELVRRLRARESNTHIFVVMTASRPTAGDMADAFYSGADDFVRKPLPRDELFARMEGMNRIRKWASRMFSGAAVDFSASDPSTLSAWRTMDAIVTSEVSDIVGAPLTPFLEPDALEASTLLAQIPLYLAFDGFQVTLSVGIAADCVKAFSAATLKSASAEPAAVRDALREIANAAGGVYKRMAAAEGKTFTLGIPVDIYPWTARSDEPIARREWTARSAGGGIVLRFEAEVRTGMNDLLPAKLLREGMILIQDLTNSAGTLLLRGGTRLTQAHLEHLTRAVGTSTLVEVAMAA